MKKGRNEIKKNECLNAFNKKSICEKSEKKRAVIKINK